MSRGFVLRIAPSRGGPGVLPQSRSDAAPSGPTPEMWKLSRNRVLLDEPPEEEDGLQGAPPASTAAPAPGSSLRGWKDVTSLFNKDDEQHLLETSKSPKSKGSNLRLKEELKAEKRSGFWDTLVLKQNIQPKKPDQIEGWEPPKLTAEDVAADAEDDPSSRPAWSAWEDDTKGSTKYTSLASSGSSSRWSLRSAGKLVSIRRQSKGQLTDTCEEVD
ncbi:testis development-related protein isoform X2 [Psammomys obesus]|uniref:testis development-related protein isoform X2 n=1 Tax=Psammomys obesus TaxID=48139 RepID=UPI002453279B|nr:testis development-related protein isoform X2 [Psammomys obesus]